MLFVKNRPVEYFGFQWTQDDLEGTEAIIGSSKWQTWFEVAGLLQCLAVWATPGATVLVLGDNTAALQEVIALKGHRQLNRLSRELAVLRARHNWNVVVAHLPSESNTSADACSRVYAPGAEGKKDPFTKMKIKQVQAKPLQELFSLLA